MSGNILTGSYFYLENDLIKFKRSNSKIRRGSGNRFGNPLSFFFSKLLIIYIINVRENGRAIKNGQSKDTGNIGIQSTEQR